MNSGFEVLLFYKYVPVEDPTALMLSQKELCTRLGMTGRTIVAHEGINATLEGSIEATTEYERVMRADPRFADLDIKRSVGTGKLFPRLSVKVRKEIVSSYWGETLDPKQVTGKHIEPEEFEKMRLENDDVVVIDMRNQYEFLVGHFDGSVLPPMKNFRDLAQVLPDLEKYKDKKVVPVCTGGIRCEKASGFLLQNGFKNVYQIHGGMVRYLEKFPYGMFKGKLYVFDGRNAIGYGKGGEGNGVVGRCGRCLAPAERYVNCANLACHDHFICCESCEPDPEKAYCSHCAVESATVSSPLTTSQS
ncbi:MAG: hypothetical protein RLZZ347_621 [Candidatus Parcubacteria bacterium]|jgi:UPF0176 protein